MPRVRAYAKAPNAAGTLGAFLGVWLPYPEIEYERSNNQKPKCLPISYLLEPKHLRYGGVPEPPKKGCCEKKKEWNYRED